MRRSLAPSQQFRSPVTKKPRFSSHADGIEKENEDFIKGVGQANTLKETLKSIRKSNVSIHDYGPNAELECEVSVPSTDRNVPLPDSQCDNAIDSTKLNNDSDTSETVNTPEKVNKISCKPKFVPPKQFISPLIASQAKGDSSLGEEVSGNRLSGSTDDSIVSHYYSVVWCKNSRKKHKKWEGDAILVTRSKSVKLKDMEGKDIGKSSGYKASELSGLVEGSSLIVGGKEIEVMGVIEEEDWLSGKCFVDSTPSSSSTNSSSSVGDKANVRSVTSTVKKGFTNPMIGVSPATKSASQAVVVPYYNPNHPNALVLPRPPSSHQQEYNRAGLPLVDVVVDPYLVNRLRPHQKDGVTFLYECVMGFKDYQGNGAILADDMGLGKTIQCISLLWTLLKQDAYGGKPVVKRALVVTPGSLVKNWCREFNKWLGSERIEVFAVTSEKRPKEYVNSKIYPVMIVSYEMFMRCYEVIKDVHFDIIICDEGHRLKNSSTKATMMLTSLPVRRRIVLTGTPIQNDLQEFYSIVEFCNPGILGSASAFRKVYEEPIVASRQPTATKEEKVMGEARASQLSDLISLFFLRRTQDINTKYLPDKVERVIFCKPTPLQLCLYKHLLRSRLVQNCLSESVASYSNSSGCPHLQCLTVLKKLCNCPSLIYHECNETNEAKNPLLGGLLSIFPVNLHDNNFTVEHSGKLKVLDMMLHQLHSQQSKDRIVLVSNYTKTLNILQRLCEVRNYKFLRLDGSTTVSKRQELVERFNAGYCNDTVFLLSSKAGGVGLNLIGANQLILYDIEWNPANDIQAMARVWRDGQKKKVFIYRLLTTGTVEEKIYQRQISKQGLSGAVVDTSQPMHNTTFSREELKDLFSLDEATSCNTHDLLNCSCTNTMGQQSNDGSSSNASYSTHQSKQFSISMDQLLQWTHHSPLSDGSYADDGNLLRGVSDGITFIFSNEVNNHPVTLHDHDNN